MLVVYIRRDPIDILFLKIEPRACLVITDFFDKLILQLVDLVDITESFGQKPGSFRAETLDSEIVKIVEASQDEAQDLKEHDISDGRRSNGDVKNL